MEGEDGDATRPTIALSCHPRLGWGVPTRRTSTETHRQPKEVPEPTEFKPPSPHPAHKRWSPEPYLCTRDAASRLRTPIQAEVWKCRIATGQAEGVVWSILRCLYNLKRDNIVDCPTSPTAPAALTRKSMGSTRMCSWSSTCRRLGAGCRTRRSPRWGGMKRNRLRHRRCCTCPSSQALSSRSRQC